MLRRLLLLVPFCLAALACGGDPMKGANAALAAGDLPKAEAALDALIAEKPQLMSARITRFVLYRHEALLGPPAKQAAYLQKGIEEFDAIAAHFQLALDYKDMEGCIKKGPPEAAALFAAAHKSIYGE